MASRTSREWLVTDPRGFFAMGTQEGFRTRKYHGFYLGIPGRTELAWVSDLEMRLDGLELWPRAYSQANGGAGAVVTRAEPSTYMDTGQGPLWAWKIGRGELRFRIEAGQEASGGGIRLGWEWEGPGRPKLEVRPFAGFRPLHAVGGRKWSVTGNRWAASDDSSEMRQLLGVTTRGLSWLDDPIWHERFHYTEEVERGYPAEESLFSAGRWQAELVQGEVAWVTFGQDDVPRAFKARFQGGARDFRLVAPAGVVAGYPWFGEWGRDTFIALPGIAAALVSGGEPDTRTWSWCAEVLSRWGKWIETEGMLPNLIDRDGVPQWESSDATLWWIHSLAGLWAMGLSPETRAFAQVEREFGSLLQLAIAAIQEGRHRFLRVGAHGLLEVEGVLDPSHAYTTWMDARHEGRAVTPRTGALPEINALWFQARALLALWRSSELGELEALAHSVLECREEGRPNGIFLHSIPLAPSFVLNEAGTLDRARKDLEAMASSLWTPVGLRTQDPRLPGYRTHCVGTQAERDQAYHQGTIWPWLGGHFEMARDRMLSSEALPTSLEGVRASDWTPIIGHVPEIHDAAPPFVPRGAPAQAWSAACMDEAHGRRRLRTDDRLSRAIARRWLGRSERRSVT